MLTPTVAIYVLYVGCVALCSCHASTATMSSSLKHSDKLRSIQEDKTEVSNLARGQPTWQSSTIQYGPNNATSNRAVDGNTDSMFWQHSCTHTYNDLNPWWMVDLGQPTYVKKVVVYNRQDCCGQWSRNFIVGLTNVPPSKQPPSLRNYALCGQYPGAFGAVGVVDCASDVPPARYLIIQLERNRVEPLILCEVEVFGRRATRVCPEDFIYIPKVNGCYRAVLENIHPALIELRCRTLHKDAHLLIVNTAREQDAVANMLHALTGNTMNTCWQYPDGGIGWRTAGRRIDQSPFVWKVAAADNCGHALYEMHYTNWQPGEPCCPMQDCMYMFSAWNYKWGDDNCVSACAVCELDM